MVAKQLGFRKPLFTVIYWSSLQVDVKSEGANVIVVKMTFPENENIQGLRAFSPTQPAELEKFNVVHEALDPSARIEQVSAVNLDELPELRRDARRVVNPPVSDVTKTNDDVMLTGLGVARDEFSVTSQNVVDFSRDLIGSHVQYSEPPTRPPRPAKEVHPSSLPPTSTTLVPIDKAIFPLEYFTESDVKRDERNVAPSLRASNPAQYAVQVNPTPPPRPRPAPAGFYPPPPPPAPIQASPKMSYPSPKIPVPPPRPKPFRPQSYSNILAPETGFKISGPGSGLF